MGKGIVTLTLNAAIDRIIVVTKLRMYDKNIANRTLVFAGGKGVNVARALAALELPAVAAGFIGQGELELYRNALERLGVITRFVPVAGHTRTNYKLVTEDTGAETEVNERGPVISESELQRLEAVLDELLASAEMLLLSGSLPPGVPPDYYAQLIQRASAHQVPCALDSSGPPLRAGLQAEPYLVKMNRSELEEGLETQFSDAADMARGLKALCAAGIGIAVASLGSDGAIATDGHDTWLAKPPAVSAKNTVGAGDVMLAGLAVSVLRGESLKQALCWATALATASVTNYEPGSVDVAAARGLMADIELAMV